MLDDALAEQLDVVSEVPELRRGIGVFIEEGIIDQLGLTQGLDEVGDGEAWHRHLAATWSCRETETRESRGVEEEEGRKEERGRGERREQREGPRSEKEGEEDVKFADSEVRVRMRACIECSL